MAGPRVIGCGVIFVLAAAAASGAFFVPGVPPPLAIFLAVGVFFVVATVGARVMTWLAPAPALVAAREQDAQMREAVLSTASAAQAGSYLRLRGTLEAVEETLVAPLTQRTCLAYRFERVGLVSAGKPGMGTVRERQRGVCARLADGSGSILVELDGVAPTATGDALADAVMAQAVAAMGEAEARLPARIEFPAGHRAHVTSEGVRGPWPSELGAPDHDRLAEVEAQHWPSASTTVRRDLSEHVLLPGDQVEVVGYVERVGDALVLTAPKNGAMQVVASAR